MEVNKYIVENCKNYFKIVEQIIFKKEKRKKRMMWQLMWHNVRVAALNATLKLLVILDADSRNARGKKIIYYRKKYYFSFKNSNDKAKNCSFLTNSYKENLSQ